MNTSPAEPRPVIPQVSGAAVTGAVLACGVVYFFSWVRRDSDQACEKTEGLCWTWWDSAAIPLTLAAALITLIIVYKQLDIRPRLAVIPPTILLAPLPLLAAQANAGWWTATIAGGTWSGFVALTAWSRYRILGVTASATLLLARWKYQGVISRRESDKLPVADKGGCDAEEGLEVSALAASAIHRRGPRLRPVRPLGGTLPRDQIPLDPRRRGTPPCRRRVTASSRYPSKRSITT